MSAITDRHECWTGVLAAELREAEDGITAPDAYADCQPDTDRADIPADLPAHWTDPWQDPAPAPTTWEAIA